MGEDGEQTLKLIKNGSIPKSEFPIFSEIPLLENKGNHELKMWICSFSGDRKLRVNFEPRFAFQQWNRDECEAEIQEYEAEESTILDELHVRKLLVVSIHKKWEELRLYNLL